MRWIVRVLTVLVVLVVAAIGLVFLLPAEKIGDLASAQLEKATGRTLTLSGQFKPTIYPVLGVKTGPLTISNADWASEPFMVRAEGASVGVGLSALMGGDLEIQQLILDTPVINLERRKDGVANWDLSQGSDAETGATGGDEPANSGNALTLAKGAIRNGRVTYRDATTGQDLAISEINADFALPKAGAANIDGSAVWDGRKTKVNLSVADLAKLIEGDVTNLTGSVEMGGLKAGLDGQVKVAADAPPLINGQFDFNLPDMDALAKLVPMALPDAMKGLKNLSLKGTIMASSAGLNLAGGGAVSMNGLPVDAKFEVIGPENWTDTLRVDANLKLTGRDAFTFTWAGLVNGRTGNADGTIDFSASNLAKTLKAVGQEVGFPKGTGRTAMVKGVVRVRDGKNTLSKARFGLDQNKFRGNAELVFDSLPYIAANLTAGALDFSAYTSDEGGSSGSGTSGSGNASGGWSKDPIRITGLDAINADVNLLAKSVDLGVSQLGRSDVKLRLRGGALRLTLREVRAYQGVITGVVGFTGGKAVSFNSDITAKGVQLEPLLGRLLGITRLTGSGNTTLNMSGTGGSLYQIMHSLTGKGRVRVDKGSFKGIDLAAMMRNLQQAFGGFDGATEFTSLTGTFTMKKGVLQNVDMSLISPLFKAEGKGQINVGEQNMSYTVTPSSLSEDAKFSVPVNITGPWSNLKFRPDMGSLVDLLANGRLEAEKAALKAKEDDLKAKAEAKLRKALNLEPEPAPEPEAETAADPVVSTEPAPKPAVEDVSIEDAAKQKAEDRVKDEIGNLLKGLLK
jgi:AsmA protein